MRLPLLTLLALLAAPLAGCDVLDSDFGEFTASLSGDRERTLRGTAYYLDEGGAVVGLLPRGSDAGAELRVALPRLARGTYGVGPEGEATVVFDPRFAEVAPEAAVFVGTSGTVTVTGFGDGEAEGRLSAVAEGPDGDSLYIEGTFRAVEL